MGTFKTMLAHKSDPKRINFETNDYYVQPKLDGIRCYITKEGMFTRNHKPIVSAPHVFEAVQYIFNDPLWEDIVLDGELYNHDLKANFSKIVSLVRKTKPSAEDLRESSLKVEYHLYDLFVPGNPDMTFRERNSLCEVLITNNFRAVPVETHKVFDMEHAQMFNDAWLKAGYEGSMIRQDSEYQQKRSWYLQKVKTFVDEEFKIVGFEERVSRSRNGVAHEPYKTGLLGKFIMEMPDGRTFGAPPGKGFDHKDLKDMWRDRDLYVDNMATVEFFEYTEYGVPRFPKYKALRNYE